MAKKRNETTSEENNIPVITHICTEIEEPKIGLLEFLEKRQITGILKRGYLRKFKITDSFTESEWLKK